MTDNRKPVFSTKRGLAIAVVGVVAVVCVGGLILLAKRFQPNILNSGNTPSVPITINGTTPQSPTQEAGQQDGKYNLSIGLSEGGEQPQSAAVIPQATDKPLSPEETNLVLSRLPALPADSSQQTEFKLPTEILPPPQPGNKIEGVFPPLATESAPSAVDTGPLKVERFAPEGEIPIAPFVSVTFSQPMVPLGTLANLSEKDVPVKIEPSLSGTWRWLGTKTLTFEYDSKLIDRLPKATEYHATVPAGTKSITGGTLAEAVTWTFKTPPPKIVTSYPKKKSMMSVPMKPPPRLTCAPAKLPKKLLACNFPTPPFARHSLV